MGVLDATKWFDPVGNEVEHYIQGNDAKQAFIQTYDDKLDRVGGIAHQIKIVDGLTFLGTQPATINLWADGGLSIDAPSYVHFMGKEVVGVGNPYGPSSAINKGIFDTQINALNGRIDKSATVTFSATEPVNPVLGLIWVKTA